MLCSGRDVLRRVAAGRRLLQACALLGVGLEGPKAVGLIREVPPEVLPGATGSGSPADQFVGDHRGDSRAERDTSADDAVVSSGGLEAAEDVLHGIPFREPCPELVSGLRSNYSTL